MFKASKKIEWSGLYDPSAHSLITKTSMKSPLFLDLLVDD